MEITTLNGTTTDNPIVLKTANKYNKLATLRIQNVKVCQGTYLPIKTTILDPELSNKVPMYVRLLLYKLQYITNVCRPNKL